MFEPRAREVVIRMVSAAVLARSGNGKVAAAASPFPLSWRLALAIMFSTVLLLPLLSARITSDTYFEEALALQDQGPAAALLARLLAWLVLAAFTALAVSHIRSMRLARPGLALYVAAMISSAAAILAAMYAIVPHVTTTLLIVPVALTAAFVLPRIEPDDFLRGCRRGILLVAYGSLVAIIVAPSWALDLHYYDSLIPGFTVRLHGLATHANTLAPLLGLFVLSELPRSSRSAVSWMNLAVVLACLVLTQSKTTWILTLAGVGVHLAFAPWTTSRLRRTLALSTVATVVVACMLFLVTTPSLLTLPWESASVRTLTGRTEIWAATLALWHRNPLFGYGPDLWNAHMSAQYLATLGVTTAHAHNQWIQVLGESGLLGFVPLVAFGLALIAYAVRYAQVAGGVALTWTIVFLLRTITETPMRASLGDSMLQQFILVALLLLCARHSATGHRALADTHGTAHPDMRSGLMSIHRPRVGSAT